MYSSNRIVMKQQIGNYALDSIIGSGAFGDVYACRHILTHRDYALKIDRTSTSTIRYEASMLKYLRKVPNIAKLIHYGCLDKKQYMVLDLYGLSLEEHIIMHGETMTPMIKVNIALQMLSIIKSIHDEGVLHRDIKPENFVFDIGLDQLFLIDFGISKVYLDKDKCHKPIRVAEHIVGSLRYASINSHDLHELSRRDDLISLCYTCLYVFFEHVPWENLCADNSYEKNCLIKRKKTEFTNTVVDDGSKLLKQLHIIVHYLYGLSYEEKPNYFLIEIQINNMLEST